MKNLLIIGARGFGREVYSLAKEAQGYHEEFVVKGFLDDKADALNGMGNYPPIIDSVEHYLPEEDDVFVCALGDVIDRKRYTDMILAKSGCFINLIHNSAVVCEFAKLGVGCIIMRDVVLSNNSHIGNFVTMHIRSGAGHDVRVGDYCEIEASVITGGGVSIEDFVTIHPGAIITPHKRIGHHAVVGAGAVVVRHVKPGITVYGNPAQRLEF